MYHAPYIGVPSLETEERGKKIVVIMKCLVNSDIYHCYNPKSKH